MPPRPRGNRGVGGNALISSKTSGSATTNGTAASSSLPAWTLDDDLHNTDQPCCRHLMDTALRILPVAKRPPSSSTPSVAMVAANATPASSPSTTAPVSSSAVKDNNSQHLSNSPSSSDPSFHGLLQEYLLSERRIRIRQHENYFQQQQQQSMSLENAKKKRKKKKKKKAATGTANGTNNAEEGGDVEEREDEEESNHNSEPNVSAKKDDVQNSTVEGAAAAPIIVDGEASMSTPEKQEIDLSIATKSHTMNGEGVSEATDTAITSTNISSSSADPQQRQRHVHRLLNRILDLQQDQSADLLDLSRLHEFVATITDNDDGTQSTDNKIASTVPSSPANKETNHSPPPVNTLISLDQVKAAVRAIQCSACRAGVERVLLPSPPLSQSLSSTRSLYNYTRKIWLKGVQVASSDDSYVQTAEEAVEAQSTHYQLLMEEGIEPPENAQHWSLILNPNRQATRNGSGNNNHASATSSPSSTNEATTVGWELRRPLMLQQQQQQPSSSADLPRRWSVSDLEPLVEQYVLLLGLPPDTVTGADTAVGDGVIPLAFLKEIESGVSEKITKHTEQFKDMAFKIHDELIKLPSNQDVVALDVDWNGFNYLLTVNDTCDVLLADLLQFLLEVTTSVLTVLLHASFGGEYPTSHSSHAATEAAVADTQWAVAQCQLLWQPFFENIVCVIASVDQYHDTLMSLVDRTGKFPEGFMSRPLRKSCHAMIRTKLDAAFFMVQKIDDRAQHETPIGQWSSVDAVAANTTTFLKRLWTEEAFYSIAPSSANVQSRESCDQVDSAWKNVLLSLREMTEIDNQRRTPVSLAIGQRQRHDKLSRLLATALGSLDEMLSHSSNVESGSVSGDARSLTLLRQDVQTLLESRPVPTDDESPSDQLASVKSWNLSLPPAIQRATHKWVSLWRCSSSVTGDERPTIPPTMPHILRRAMAMGDRVFAEEEPCRGGDGHLRASCILVSLFFENMSNSFKEWQAHRAAQELLTTMEEGDGNAAQASSKGSKKSKKKTPKKTPSSTEKKTASTDETESLAVANAVEESVPDSPEINHRDTDETDANVPLSEIPKVVEDPAPAPPPASPQEDDQDTKQMATTADAASGTAVLLPTNGSDHSTVDSGPVSNEETPLACDSRVDISTPLASDATSHATTTTVGVYDDRTGTFEEAEAFFVGRLLHALTDVTQDVYHD